MTSTHPVNSSINIGYYANPSTPHTIDDNSSSAVAQDPEDSQASADCTECASPELQSKKVTSQKLGCSSSEGLSGYVSHTDQGLSGIVTDVLSSRRLVNETNTGSTAASEPGLQGAVAKSTVDPGILFPSAESQNENVQVNQRSRISQWTANCREREVNNKNNSTFYDYSENGGTATPERDGFQSSSAVPDIIANQSIWNLKDLFNIIIRAPGNLISGTWTSSQSRLDSKGFSSVPSPLFQDKCRGKPNYTTDDLLPDNGAESFIGIDCVDNLALELEPNQSNNNCSSLTVASSNNHSSINTTNSKWTENYSATTSSQILHPISVEPSGDVSNIDLGISSVSCRRGSDTVKKRGKGKLRDNTKCKNGSTVSKNSCLNSLSGEICSNCQRNSCSNNSSALPNQNNSPICPSDVQSAVPDASPGVSEECYASLGIKNCADTRGSKRAQRANRTLTPSNQQSLNLFACLRRASVSPSPSRNSSAEVSPDSVVRDDSSNRSSSHHSPNPGSSPRARHPSSSVPSPAPPEDPPSSGLSTSTIRPPSSTVPNPAPPENPPSSGLSTSTTRPPSSPVPSSAPPEDPPSSGLSTNHASEASSS